MPYSRRESNGSIFFYFEVLTKQWYIDVLARIRINAFRIELVGGSYEDLLLLASSSVNGDAAVGSAIYMLPSFYNHDCGENHPSSVKLEHSSQMCSNFYNVY